MLSVRRGEEEAHLERERRPMTVLLKNSVLRDPLQRDRVVLEPGLRVDLRLREIAHEREFRDQLDVPSDTKVPDQGRSDDRGPTSLLAKASVSELHLHLAWSGDRGIGRKKSRCANASRAWHSAMQPPKRRENRAGERTLVTRVTPHEVC